MSLLYSTISTSKHNLKSLGFAKSVAKYLNKDFSHDDMYDDCETSKTLPNANGSSKKRKFQDLDNPSDKCNDDDGCDTVNDGLNKKSKKIKTKIDDEVENNKPFDSESEDDCEEIQKKKRNYKVLKDNNFRSLNMKRKTFKQKGKGNGNKGAQLKRLKWKKRMNNFKKK